MEVLFALLAERYEPGSVMLTSNLPFSGWKSIFKDPMTTAAAIDRLVHHSVILKLNVPNRAAGRTGKMGSSGKHYCGMDSLQHEVKKQRHLRSRTPGRQLLFRACYNTASKSHPQLISRLMMTTALILRRENLMRFGILFLLAFALRWSYYPGK